MCQLVPSKAMPPWLPGLVSETLPVLVNAACAGGDARAIASSAPVHARTQPPANLAPILILLAAPDGFDYTADSRDRQAKSRRRARLRRISNPSGVNMGNVNPVKGSGTAETLAPSPAAVGNGA